MRDANVNVREAKPASRRWKVDCKGNAPPSPGVIEI